MAKPAFPASLIGSILICSSAAFAAPPAPIGIVTASGHFTLEGSSVWGNSTLFDGARVETGQASSQLSLRNGVKVQLAANSSARIWQDHLILDRGAGQIASPSSFEVTAAGAKVSGERFRVGLADRLEVAAVTGTTRVLAANGLRTTIPAGRNMSFAMFQDVTVVGCLLYKDGGFILPVDGGEVTQLLGPDLATNVGNRVEATGTAATSSPTVSPATRVLNVTSIAPQSQGGCLTTAAAFNASASVPAGAAAPGAAAPKAVPAAAGGQPAPAAPRTGLSTGAKVGIAAAVGGGAVAGIVIATKGGKKSTSQ